MSQMLAASLLDRLRALLPFSTRWGTPPIDTLESLKSFLDSRSAFVAQETLYGYIKTRSGTRHVQLFTDDLFVSSINIAKWRLYIACLSDLSVYAGAVIAARTRAADDEVTALMTVCQTGVLDAHGNPAGADGGFAEAAAALPERLARTRFLSVPDNETAFEESPEALVYWAPIAEELKVLDAEIVRNSIRFKWRHVREQFRGALQADAVMAAWRAGPDRRPD